MKQREFVVLGSDHTAKAFFESRSLRITADVPTLSPGKHGVVIWDSSRLSQAEKRHIKVFEEFLRAGGSMLVLSSPAWDWPELCDVKLNHGQRFSRVFPYPDLKSPLPGNLDPQWLVRWNGLPGTVGLGSLEGPAMAHAEKMLWAKEPKITIMAKVPAASGNGRILFAQLDLKGRLDQGTANYDPAAERVLLNLLEGNL